MQTSQNSTASVRRGLSHTHQRSTRLSGYQEPEFNKFLQVNGTMYIHVICIFCVWTQFLRVA